MDPEVQKLLDEWKTLRNSDTKVGSIQFINEVHRMDEINTVVKAYTGKLPQDILQIWNTEPINSSEK